MYMHEVRGDAPLWRNMLFLKTTIIIYSENCKIEGPQQVLTILPRHYQLIWQFKLSVYSTEKQFKLDFHHRDILSPSTDLRASLFCEASK